MLAQAWNGNHSNHRQVFRVKFSSFHHRRHFWNQTAERLKQIVARLKSTRN